MSPNCSLHWLTGSQKTSSAVLLSQAMHRCSRTVWIPRQGHTLQCQNAGRNHTFLARTTVQACHHRQCGVHLLSLEKNAMQQAHDRMGLET